MRKVTAISLVAASALSVTAVLADAIVRHVVVARPTTTNGVATPKRLRSTVAAVPIDAAALAAAKHAAFVGLQATGPSKLAAPLVVDPLHLAASTGAITLTVSADGVAASGLQPGMWWLQANSLTDRSQDGYVELTANGMVPGDPLLLECTFNRQNTPSAHVIIATVPGYAYVHDEKVDLDGDQILYAFRVPSTGGFDAAITPNHLQHGSSGYTSWTGCKIHPVL